MRKNTMINGLLITLLLCGYNIVYADNSEGLAQDGQGSSTLATQAVTTASSVDSFSKLKYNKSIVKAQQLNSLQSTTISSSPQSLQQQANNSIIASLRDTPLANGAMTHDQIRAEGIKYVDDNFDEIDKNRTGKVSLSDVENYLAR